MDNLLCEPLLESRIALRRLELSDAVPMLEWMKNPDIYEKMQYDPEKQSLEQCIAFIKDSWEDTQNLHYAIIDSENEYLGTISLKNVDKKNRNAELGLVLHPKAMGKGVGAEALKLITFQAFEEMNLHKVYLYVRKDNERAVKFYKKNGWECEGEFKAHIFVRGEYRDIYWFAIHNKEIYKWQK